MSYDLEVYGKRALSTRELAKLVSVDRTLSAQVDKKADAVDAVVWTKTRAHVFTIDGPVEVEPEDLPEDWPEGEGASVLYSLQIAYDVSPGPESSSVTVDGASTDAAMAFAARLANRIDGAVMDPQTWEPPEGVSEEVEEPEPVRERYLHMTWWRLRDDTNDFAEVFLRTAREFFPAAVPTRFGTYEPMQGRLPRDDDAAFGAVYRDECKWGSLEFATSSQGSGRLSSWNNDAWGRVHALDLTHELARLEKAGIVGEIEPFFVALAERTSAVFAFASVTNSRYVSGHFRFLPRGQWSGLPADPRWMTWFGVDYADLVRDHLDPALVTSFPHGLLHRWTNQPVSADELQRISGDAWLPGELSGTPDPDDERRCSEAAAIMPDALRYPPEGSPQALRIEAHYALMREKEARGRRIVR